MAVYSYMHVWTYFMIASMESLHINSESNTKQLVATTRVLKVYLLLATVWTPLCSLLMLAHGSSRSWDHSQWQGCRHIDRPSDQASAVLQQSHQQRSDGSATHEWQQLLSIPCLLSACLGCAVSDWCRYQHTYAGFPSGTVVSLHRSILRTQWWPCKLTGPSLVFPGVWLQQQMPPRSHPPGSTRHQFPVIDNWNVKQFWYIATPYLIFKHTVLRGIAPCQSGCWQENKNESSLHIFPIAFAVLSPSFESELVVLLEQPGSFYIYPPWMCGLSWEQQQGVWAVQQILCHTTFPCNVVRYSVSWE